MDRLEPEQRSLLMGKVRGQDTGIEITLRKLLWKAGMRYRKNYRVHGVRADLVFPKERLAVFDNIR